MAVSMWRMNGLWRKVAGVLVLCVLLLSNKVICQDESTSGPSDISAAGPTAGGNMATDGGAPIATGAPTVGVVPTSGGQDSAASGAPGDILFPSTILNVLDTNRPAVSDVAVIVKLVSPVVKCVAKEDISESNVVKAVVRTGDCNATKRIIEGNAAPWCNSDDCNLEIAQDDNTILVASKNAPSGSLSKALQSLKNELGVTKTEVPPSSSSSGSSVFVGILVSGLLAALGIIVGYFKCPRRSDAKVVRLAEEAYPVDQENQGNTLVSVAPLNPPPETQEKPSVNGESPEAAKTQPPPPTNGHSTAKTADTEL